MFAVSCPCGSGYGPVFLIKNGKISVLCRNCGRRTTPIGTNLDVPESLQRCKNSAILEWNRMTLESPRNLEIHEITVRDSFIVRVGDYVLLRLYPNHPDLWHTAQVRRIKRKHEGEGYYVTVSYENGHGGMVDSDKVVRTVKPTDLRAIIALGRVTKEGVDRYYDESIKAKASTLPKTRT